MRFFFSTCLVKTEGKGVNSGIFSVQTTVTSDRQQNASLRALSGRMLFCAGKCQRDEGQLRPRAGLGSGGRRRIAATEPGGLQENCISRDD